MGACWNDDMDDGFAMGRVTDAMGLRWVAMGLRWVCDGSRWVAMGRVTDAMGHVTDAIGLRLGLRCRVTTRSWMVTHNTSDFSINNDSIYDVNIYGWISLVWYVLKNEKKMKECIGACWKGVMGDVFAMCLRCVAMCRVTDALGLRCVAWLMHWCRVMNGCS